MAQMVSLGAWLLLAVISVVIGLFIGRVISNHYTRQLMEGIPEKVPDETEAAKEVRRRSSHVLSNARNRYEAEDFDEAFNLEGED